MRRQHVAERTCIACRTRKAKVDLQRLVNTSDSGLVVDEAGTLAGRGLYLCRQDACWRQAIGRGKIGRALRRTLTESERARLSGWKPNLEQPERSAQSS